MFSKCALDFNAVNHLSSHILEMKIIYIVVHDDTVDKHVWAARNHISVQWVG